MTEERDELLDEIDQLADELGQVPRQKDVQEESERSISAYRRVFGSWNEAIEAAGYKPYPERRRIPVEDLLDELHRLHSELGESPSAEQMTAYGEYSHAVYIDRFGSWSEALAEVGLSPKESEKPSRNDLLDELRRLHDELGRVPSSNDLEEHGQYPYAAYYREFDGFTNALSAANVL